jgi:hypothetical protein
VELVLRRRDRDRLWRRDVETLGCVDRLDVTSYGIGVGVGLREI